MAGLMKRNTVAAEQAKAVALQRVGKVCIGNAVLNVEQVLHIKRCLAAGYDRRELAKLYGVGKETIARIDRGDTWGHVKLGEGEMGGEEDTPQLVPVPFAKVSPVLESRQIDPEEVKASAERLQRLLLDAADGVPGHVAGDARVLELAGVTGKVAQEQENARAALGAFVQPAGVGEGEGDPLEGLFDEQQRA